jgi:hypothetical protein
MLHLYNQSAGFVMFGFFNRRQVMSTPFPEQYSATMGTPFLHTGNATLFGG